ncbi:hypothetical protein V5E97_00695 [Singulisphaera sp. Ch08]|uniref:Trypsin-like serine protease n=1 Tax=Singulisphaera sp. Ch08 TaxID=3120278 RepID=A0AAU7CGS9_9BACT
MKFKEAIQTLEKHALAILSQPNSNIRLLAVGTKEHGPLSKATDYCISAYVPEKLTKAQLKNRDLVAFDQSVALAAGAPALERIELNVIESGSDFTPRQTLSAPAAFRGQYGGQTPAIDTQKYFDQLRCGIGITNPTDEYPGQLSVGTLGFFVRDGHQQLYLVSNSHVIGRSGNAVEGESVVQPGTLDLTANELQIMNTLAKLRNRTEIARVRAVVPFQFVSGSQTPINRVDAAMATINEPGRGQGDVDRVCYGGIIRGVADAYRTTATGTLVGSTRVHKVGRTTGATEGNVVGVAGTGMLTYATGQAFFSGQLVIEGTPDNGGLFSDRGDSGSAILNDRHELAGLLFAGSERQTLANTIADVLRELQATSGLTLRVVTG